MSDHPEDDYVDLSFPEFSDELDDLLDAYDPGVLPGCSSIEIIQASRFGFTAFQARAVLDDDALLVAVRRSWDEFGVPPVVREQAQGPTEVAGPLTELLQRTGHAVDIDDDEIEYISWSLLADSMLTAGAVKGDEGETPDSAETWTIDDPLVDAAVLIAREGVGYRVRCVPETTRGPAFLALRWQNGSDTRVPVTVTAGEVIDVLIESPADQRPDAVAFIER